MGRGKSKFLRSSPKIEPLKTALCACEGAVTEPEYISALVKSRGLGKRFKLVQSHSDPCSIVKKIVAEKKKCRNRGESRDYWIAVFDSEFDEPRRKSIVKARKLANKNGIICIESNPAFELWLLLHFSKSDKPYGDIDDLKDALKRYIPDYDKIAGILYKQMDKIIERVPVACENALWIKEHGLYGNSTEMPNLIWLIDGMVNLKVRT